MHINSGCDVTVSSLAKSLILLDDIHMLKVPGRMLNSLQYASDFSTFYMMETQIQKLITSKGKQHSIRDFFQSALA